MRSWRSLAPLLLASMLACHTDMETTSPSFSHTGLPDIKGSVFLASGENICTRFPSGAALLVRALSVNGTFFADDFPTCPSSSFSLAVEPDSYLVRVSLPTDQPLGQLPERWLQPAAVGVEADDVMRNLRVRSGAPLKGRATLDGAPIPGLGLTALYGHLPFLAGAATSITSDASGAWKNFGGEPVHLQRGLPYIFSGCVVLPSAGIRDARIRPEGPVLFPAEGDEVNCEYTKGSALRFTHRVNRLKLSSFPGDIGGMSTPMLFPNVGFGYSAQFPLAPKALPKAGPQLENRQIFNGGLVLAIAPDVALSGVELGAYISCSVSPCQALGFDGRASITPLPDGRREITWAYTDAGSLRPMGLRVQQKSFDARNLADYVLYVFRITNGSTAPITFTPGLFLDFDLLEVVDNTGYTALDGRLMVTTGPGGAGNHLGSVILRTPTGGSNYFFSLFTGRIPEADVVAALRGKIRNPVSADPSDISLLHGGTTVTLRPGRSTDFWAAIVAGDNRTQAVAHARAAITDAQARRAAGDPFAMPATASGWETFQSAGPSQIRAASSASKTLCKVGCSRVE
jgi:hypothetical protein